MGEHMGKSLSPEQLEAWRLFLEAHASVTRILEREMMAVSYTHLTLPTTPYV